MKTRPKRGVFTLAHNRTHPPVGVGMELTNGEGVVYYRTFSPLHHSTAFKVPPEFFPNGISVVKFTTWRA